MIIIGDQLPMYFAIKSITVIQVKQYTISSISD